MFLKKAKEKRLKGIMQTVTFEVQEMKKSIEFLKDWGNLTKRKNNKLRATDYLAIKNNLFIMPLVMVTALSIINENPILKKKYTVLRSEIENEIEKRIKNIQELKEQEANGNVTKKKGL